MVPAVHWGSSQLPVPNKAKNSTLLGFLQYGKRIATIGKMDIKKPLLERLFNIIV
jgi:hypothetical protein